MNELKGLLRRDTYLLWNVSKRRLLLFSIVLVAVNVSYNMMDGMSYAIEGVKGISVSDFKQNPRIPYYIIWQLIGPVLVGMDMVKKDLFQHGSSIIVKLRSRRRFWASKLIIALNLCILMSLIGFAVGYVINCRIMSHSSADSEIYFRYLVGNFLFGSMGSYLIFCIYSLLSLLLNEIVSIIICLALICSGLSNGSNCFIINNYMIARVTDYSIEGSGSLQFSIIYLCAAVFMISVIGAIAIGKIDIYGKEG